jgi:hypothetical protein
LSQEGDLAHSDAPAQNTHAKLIADRRAVHLDNMPEAAVLKPHAVPALYNIFGI